MRFLVFIIGITFFSCSKSPEKFGTGYFSTIQLKLDTVTIYPSDHILDLRSHIRGSDISVDKKYLYNFNFFDHSIEKINLNELRLEKKIPFEIEGSNGTGDFMGGIKINPDNQFTIFGITHTILLSLDGQKLRTISFEDFGYDYAEELASFPILDQEVDRLYIVSKGVEERNYTLLILDLESYETLRYPLKSLDKLNDHIFTLKVGNASVIFRPYTIIEKFGTQIILSNQTSNEFIIFDTAVDSLFLKSYKSLLTNSKKAHNYQTLHESEQSLEKEYSKFLQDINFLPPFWDEINQVFYRFSYEEIKDLHENNQDKKVNVYLTVFDRELNWLGEAEVPQFNKISKDDLFAIFPKHFAKDGNIWIYKNIEDELGFIVLELHKTNNYKAF
ncbi:DUF4221 family protein [Algoriphagus namhaensis]